MGGEADGRAACRGPGRREAGPRAAGLAAPHLLAPRSSGPLQSPCAPADFSFLRMVFGLLPVWLAVFGLARSGGCRKGSVHPLLCWCPGASLAALGGDSLRVSLLLLLHLLHDFPDLALGRLASKEMPNNSDDHFLVFIRRLVTRHDDFCAG